MSDRKPAVFSVRVRFLTCLIVISVLSVSTPAANTGYWFGDSDSYSSYGMITKVVERRGMSWTAGPEAQGTVDPGTLSETKKAEYNYPLITSNQTGRTNGANLSDAPTYETLTESWAEADVAEPAVTRYKILQTASPRLTSVVQPNGSISRQYAYNYTSLPATHPDKFKDGLIYSDETYVPDAVGTFTFPDLGLTGNYKRVAKSNVEWQQGHYWSPRPMWMEVFDENGHKVKTVYEYPNPGWFNQITRSCDYDNGNNLLRCATATYENDPSYIGAFNAQYAFQGGRHIFNLVKSTGIENSDGTRASFTEYEYDNYQAQPFANAPDVIQHRYTHDKFTTAMQDGPTCLNGEWNNSQCTYEGEIVYTVPWPTEVVCHFECYEYEQISAYDPSTEKRGNVTKVTAYSDAQNFGGAIVETRAYDITGNMVKSSSACCEQTSIAYDDPATTEIDTQYAYPVSQTRGAADPNSPHRITTTAVYDFTTGLLKQATDANGLTSATWYDPNTLRPVKSVSRPVPIRPLPTTTRR